MFKPVDQRQDFTKLEKEVLSLWDKEQTFALLRKQLAGKEAFSFLDGPITANNPMGVHHAWGRTLKDIFQRYKAMQGFDQRWQNGFDCQGLWVEVEVEKDLGFNSKKEIRAFGLDKFSRACRERVEKYAKIIDEQSKRLGQWYDFNNSYYTFSDTNIEYIWHFLKTCDEKGWLYIGNRSMPWCSRCGTSLSAHELADGYTEMTHESVYFLLPIKEQPGEYLLAWTTTPWTLLANVAAAVHPKLTYIKIQHDDKILYLAKDRLKAVYPEAKILAEVPGTALAGLHYEGPFDDLPSSKVEHQVVLWQEVSAEEGTGIVHIAPGCGAEDHDLAQELRLPLIRPVDEAGIYVAGFADFTGKATSEVRDQVFASLKAKDRLFRTEPITHRYPGCWRCGQELIWRIADEWFISAEKIRPLMQKAAAKANWLPESIGKRMQDWLVNMRDWCISRKRFWGLPLPFYRCECGELTVVSSKAELIRLATTEITEENLPELHLPWIDQFKIACPKCGKDVSRVPEVGDCWLDAGIVPFSTLKYFADKAYWQKWFPAELVCEMREQVRLWFYSLLFMSVTLENTTPYRNVLSYEKVMDETGRAMHKSWGNAIWFDQAVEKMGADVMRWIYAKQNVTANLLFGYKLADAIRRKVLTLWNTYSFFVTYANIDQWQPKASAAAPSHSLDKWILAELQDLISKMTGSLDSYDTVSAINAADEFIDHLSNWYVRRSRRRFWKSQNDTDKESAYQTLHTVLLTLSRLLAPILPFVSEVMYRNLSGDQADASVHLTAYPQADESQKNDELKARMRSVRDIVSFGLSARADAGIKVRQPLASLSFWSTEKFAANEEEIAIIQEEVNVKAVKLLRKAPAEESAQGTEQLKVILDTAITPALAEEGLMRELIRHIQGLRKEADFNVADHIQAAIITLDDKVKQAVEHHQATIKTETLMDNLATDLAAAEISKELKVAGAHVTIKLKRI